MRNFFIILFLVTGFIAEIHGQPCTPEDSLLLTRIKKVLPVFSITTGEVALTGFPDSSFVRVDSSRVKALTQVVAIDHRKEKNTNLRFEKGYVQYTMNYREAIDTPFLEKDIHQHVLITNGQFVAGGVLPVAVTYFERKSNSVLFRDYRDFRVVIDPALFRQLQAQRAKHKVIDKLKGLQDLQAADKAGYEEMLGKLSYTKGVLNSPDMIALLTACKERLINREEYPSSCAWKDSVELYADVFIERLSRYEKNTAALQQQADSLKLRMDKFRKLGALAKQFLTKPGLQPKDLELLRTQAAEWGVDVDTRSSMNTPGFQIANRLRHLSFGRVIPSMSPLTVNAITIRGLQFALEGTNWYAAFTAGVVDMRLFDFNRKPEKLPRQFLYSIRAGIGQKEKTHFHITAYKGTRLLYPGSLTAARIAGVSVTLQYLVAPGHRISVEMAQSVSSQSVSGNAVPFNKFSLRNNDSRGYFAQWQSYFPRLNARVEANYQKLGIDFQSFMAYRVNAATAMYSIRYDQGLFKNALTVRAAVRKNDFANPFIVQDYNANTVFTSLQLSYRKRNGPVVTAGYLPSSQYSKVGELIYETRYQIINASFLHTYPVGVASTTTHLFVSKFFDNSGSAVYLYNNAATIGFTQQLGFRLHKANLSIQYTGSEQFTLGMVQAGLGTAIIKNVQVESGVKLFRSRQAGTKTGLYSQASFTLEKWGTIKFWLDDGFLPSPSGKLISNRQWTISYMKLFKKTKA